MKPLLLPDFCAPRAVLMVLVIVALTAVLLTLAVPGPGPRFWGELGLRLLLLIWIGLIGAALLCALRTRIARHGARRGALLVMGVVVLAVLVVSEAAWWVLNSPLFAPSTLIDRPRVSHELFLARNVAIGLVVGAMALRYAYVAQQWRLNVEAQARARADALQARIRPHFLYNSMNTIASLTRTDPARAEEAVLDLAELFRANLDEQRNLITLEQELDNARAYLRIEQLRMGDRLRVHWDVKSLPMQARLPSLTLQPLLENAVLHGVSQLPGGGDVHVQGSVADDTLTLSVRNPLPASRTPAAGDTASQDAATSKGTSSSGIRQGHGIALDNIRERLALLHGARASVIARREGDAFLVQLSFPVIEAAPPLAG